MHCQEGRRNASQRPGRTATRRRRSKLIMLPVAIPIALLGGGCGRDLPEGFVGSGILDAETVIVSAELSGTVLELPFDEGDFVHTGDTLAVLDVETLQLQHAEAGAALSAAAAQVRQAEAALGAAREELANVKRRAERIRRLGERGSASEQTQEDLETQERVSEQRRRAAEAGLEAARAQRERAAATLDLLQRRIRNGTLRAPLAGTILTRFVRAGELAAPGRAIVEIANLDEFWIKVYVAAEELGRIELGQAVRIYPDGLPGARTGQVSWISPKAEFTPKNVQTREARADLVFAVKVTLPNEDGDLKPGLPADVAW